MLLQGLSLAWSCFPRENSSLGMGWFGHHVLTLGDLGWEFQEIHFSGDFRIMNPARCVCFHHQTQILAVLGFIPRHSEP